MKSFWLLFGAQIWCILPHPSGTLSLYQLTCLGLPGHLDLSLVLLLPHARLRILRLGPFCSGPSHTYLEFLSF